MGLTWRDLASTVALSMILLAYAAFLARLSLPLISTAWAANATVLALSAVCALLAASDLHTTPQPRWGVIARKITTVTGAVALAAGLVGMIGDSGHALKIVVVAMIMLWATATCWHVYTIGSEQ